jgi:hypothetical protein
MLCIASEVFESDTAFVTSKSQANRVSSMVLLILTQFGLPETIEAARTANASVWLNAGLLETTKVAELRAAGLDLTVFARWVDPQDSAEVDDAVSTMREHHPGRMLFVECPDPAQ